MVIYSLGLLHCWGHFAGAVCRVTLFLLGKQNLEVPVPPSLVETQTQGKLLGAVCQEHSEEGQHCVKKHAGK